MNPTLSDLAFRLALVLSISAATSTPGFAQIDQAEAYKYFAEARHYCERDGGALWGVSLCGPIVFATPEGKSIVTNQRQPSAPKPAALGYANMAIKWGDDQWSAFIWPLPQDETRRGILLMHEIFHRVQPRLDLFLPEPDNAHLDTLTGRYFLQLEWRALEKALRSKGDEKKQAITDALGFRRARHEMFPGAAENERVLEINEGLPQYSATRIVLQSPIATAANAASQLSAAPTAAGSYVRNFAYATGAAFGILLDQAKPGWQKSIKSSDDLATLLAGATNIIPAAATSQLEEKYGGGPLRASEQRREEIANKRLKELQQRFVNGPLVQFPYAKGFAFTNSGLTPLPGHGTIYPTFRSTSNWGALSADLVLVSRNHDQISVPGPMTIDGTTARGADWTFEIADSWDFVDGERLGDKRLVERVK